jgi:oxygen-independent coproporphyrinogen-3 oxidase
VPKAYVDALCREIHAYDGPDCALSVFFGGGTPSLLAPAAIDRILEAVHARFDLRSAAEITVEANPDDVNASLVRAWQEAGVNRVSLGVQSFDDRVLRFLGRRHDAAKAEAACGIVAEAFENWSLDLIFGAEPIEAWPDTVERARQWAPTHLSAYGLTYEPGTPFEKRAESAIEDEQWLALYRRAASALEGYERYEISNYARPGYQCIHNLIYWHNEAYAGFGPGAYSYADGVRARNLVSEADYLGQPGEKAERLVLSESEQRVETVIQHLRLRDGLPREYYRERFGDDPLEVHGDALRGLEGAGLVVIGEDRICPTTRGFELNNEIGLALVG